MNRQFSYGWNTEINTNMPSSQNYNGTSSFTEPEVVAIREALNQRDFVAGISYHSMEGAIYWDLGQEQSLRDKTLVLANHCHNITGYKLGEVSKPRGLDYNYMNFEKNIPSVCIETGTVQCPLPYSQFNKLWVENNMLMVMISDCYQY